MLIFALLNRIRSDMSLKCMVKLSGVNNLSDARYGAGMGVELMGFPLDMEGGISVETYGEITSWVSGPAFVAEFEHPDVNHMLEVISNCHPDYIEIRTPEHLNELSHLSIPLILNWPIGKIDSLPLHLDFAFLLLEGTENLSSAMKQKIKDLSTDYKIILGAGINAGNIESLLEELPLAGISLRGGDEIRAGYKDYDELADILEILEAD